MADTIAAIATGTLVSAIGIVRMSGDKAIDIADRIFKPSSGKKMSSYPDRKLVYGSLEDIDGKVMDICLCTISRAPGTYTGEDTAEFQCHGSPTVLRQLLEATFALGARQAGPGEFTKRAFLNGRMGLTQAEAVIDIIDAESAEAAKNAVGQLGGAIQQKADNIYSDLADISAHYHAVLDYPDEDIEDFQLKDYADLMEKDRKELRKLLDTADRGKLMNEGIPTAIIGRPNAGKSSLMNALLGFDRAIVTSVPGTTRDTIEEKAKVGGVTLRLIDTAGVNDTTEDIVEKLGVERSRRALQKAELVILVIDASEKMTSEDRQLLEEAKKAPHCILVFSKSDIAPKEETEMEGIPVVSLSSLTGEGIDVLEQTVNKMYPLPNVPAGEILTNSRQADAVRRALEVMTAAEEAMNLDMTPDIVLTELQEAMKIIGELSGRNVGEDITNRIFSRFCVGK